MRFVSTEDEAAVRTLVGTDALLRARGHVARGEVADLQWKPETGRAQGRLDGLASGTVSAAPGVRWRRPNWRLSTVRVLS